MDLVFAAAIGALCGPLCVIAPWATIASAMVAAAAYARGPWRTRVAFVAAATAFGAWGWARAAGAVADGRARADRAMAEVGPQRCELEGDVDGSPTQRGDQMRVFVRTTRAQCDDRALAPGSRVALWADARGAVGRGDHVAAFADLAPPEKLWNPELGDPWPRLARVDTWHTGTAASFVVLAHGHGPRAWIDRARAHARDRIVASFEAEAAPMARALVLGESDLDPADDEAFRASGLAHLLAVSGMHLVLVVLGFERALRFLLVRCDRWSAACDVGRIAAAFAIPVAWLYADFAGGSGSALRAAAMSSGLLLARAGGRRGCAARALALSTLGLVLVDPLAAFDVSLTLSIAATAGLLAFGASLTRFFSGASGTSDAKPSVLPRSLAATVAATITCAPLLAGMGTTLPIGGVFANLIAVPLGEVAALPLCILHTILAPLPALERGCGAVASAVLLVVRAVARGCAGTPWLALPVPSPTPLQVGMAFAAMAVVVCAQGKKRVVLLTACATLALVSEVALRAHAKPHGTLRVTMLDVGQGDALLVDLPNGEAMLLDAGGLVGSPVDIGARVIAPLLRARRRDALAVVALSHPHPDHYGGLASGTRRTRVREAWSTGQSMTGTQPAARAMAELAARGAHVFTAASLCGERFLGGARVEVLAPCPTFDPARGANDNSFVFRVSYGARSFLFVGDAEREAEVDLVRKYGRGLAADVLKVGHHGSATSTTPAFLRAVSPKLAIVSSGIRNRFRHPRAETLDTLGREGVHVLRTDREGQIVVETDGEHLSFATARFTP